MAAAASNGQACCFAGYSNFHFRVTPILFTSCSSQASTDFQVQVLNNAIYYSKISSNRGMLVDTAADLSRPISTLLREGTSKAHKAAEVSPGAGWLARGELDRDEYVRYLMMLWHIYE